jgi:hypothetical protein
VCFWFMSSKQCIVYIGTFQLYWGRIIFGLRLFFRHSGLRRIAEFPLSNWKFSSHEIILNVLSEFEPKAGKGKLFEGKDLSRLAMDAPCHFIICCTCIQIRNIAFFYASFELQHHVVVVFVLLCYS